MATYVNDLRLKEIATGDESGTWGASTNTNLELIGEAFSFGTEAITTNANTHTTTIADGSTDPGRSMYLKYTGTLDSACTITIGPNTVSKMWFIENGTSGSQNIIISQGSGANITIPPGDVKVIYSDGAGSGAAVVDAFASLSVVDLKVQDDLTVTDDMTVGGTLGVTGVLTATSLDISGDIDVDGTTNLDVVDIDGAVDMATTLAVAGNVDFNGDLDVDGTTNLDVVDIDGAVDMASTLNVSGAITGTLGTAAQTNITSLGTLTTLTVDDITINGSTISDSGSLTLDVGTDLTLDADSGNIFLKDGGTHFGTLQNNSSDLRIVSIVQDKDLILRGNDGGSFIDALTLDMSNAGAATFNTSVLLSGTGGLTTTGGNNLTVSGSAADHAGLIFATHAILPAEEGAEASPNVIDIGANGNEFKSLYLNTSIITDSDLTLDVGGDIILDADGGEIKIGDDGVKAEISFPSNSLQFYSSTSDADIIFKGNDGGSAITALTLDMSDAGRATFNNKASFNNPIAVGQSTFSGGSVLADFHGSGSGVGAQLAFANDHNTSKFFVGIEGNTSGDGFLYQQQNADINFYTNNTLHAKLHNDGAFVTTPTAGGHAVFNENSVDADFRVESNGNANMLFVDGGNDRVGVGINNPTRTFEVNSGSTNAVARFESTDSRASLEFKDNSGTAALGCVGNHLSFLPANSERMVLNDEGGLIVTPTTGGHSVFNEGSVDADFRVESNGNTHMLFVDGGNDRIGIGTSAPTDPLTIHDGTPSIKFKDTSSNGEAFWSLDGTSMSFYNKSTGGSMAFGTANTERMKLLGTGNLSLALGVPLQATADGRAVNASVGTSFVTILDFSTIGGTNAGTGFYLVTVVREGASVGTSITLQVGVSGSGLVIIYDTLQATGLSAQASNAQIQVKQPSGGTVECHATAIPMSVTGHDS